MKLFIETKKLSFNEEDNLIEQEVILRVSDIEFYGYDLFIELKDDDKFIKDTMKIIYKKNDKGKDTKEIEGKVFMIREQETWNSFPLYQIIGTEIVEFDWKKYSYFLGTDRRMALASKINELYNPSSEAKIIRRTIKFILDELNLSYPEFEKYNQKVYNIINKFSKNRIK